MQNNFCSELTRNFKRREIGQNVILISNVAGSVVRGNQTIFFLILSLDC